MRGDLSAVRRTTMSWLSKAIGLDKLLGKQDPQKVLETWLRDRALHLPHATVFTISRRLGVPIAAVEYVNDQLAAQAVRAIGKVKIDDWYCSRVLRLSPEVQKEITNRLSVTSNDVLKINNEVENRLLYMLWKEWQ
jgi:hypothetical protein